MKRNNLFKLGLFTVFVAILSLTLVSGTFAKYTSTVTGSDSAKVAKWEWQINDDNVVGGTATTEFTFDLFNITAEDINVAKDESGNILLAPGTKGSFEMTIKNLSEVKGKYTIAFDSTTDATITPIKYSFSNSESESDWKDTIAELTKTSNLEFKTGEETITVYWKWDFSVDTAEDTTDTNLGLSNSAHTVKATIVFTQVG